MNAPDMLVFTRFGIWVTERPWLEHRLALTSAITAPSLLAQTDQRFQWALLIDANLPDDIRASLERMIEPFEGRAFLHEVPLDRPPDLVGLARDRGLGGHGCHLLTGRIDDDDAWCTTMVQAVRERVLAWLGESDRAPGVSISFQDGLEWIMYEMLDVETLAGTGERIVHAPAVWRYRCPFISMSVFVCSPFASGATAMAGKHAAVGDHLAETLGFATEVISTDLPMWLYCRHKQASSGPKKANGEEVHWSLAELASRFGLDRETTQDYLASADGHQYAVVTDIVTKKWVRLVERARIRRTLQDPATTSSDAARLQYRESEIDEELADLATTVLGNPDG